jgi:hypothetical protein
MQLPAVGVSHAFIDYVLVQRVAKLQARVVEVSALREIHKFQ